MIRKQMPGSGSVRGPYSWKKLGGSSSSQLSSAGRPSKEKNSVVVQFQSSMKYPFVIAINYQVGGTFLGGPLRACRLEGWLVFAVSNAVSNYKHHSN